MALTNVDRQADPGTADRSYGPQPQPAIFQLFANTIDAKCVDIEFHAIVCGLCQDFSKRREHRFRARVTEAQQVKVARAAMRIIKPAHHQNRAPEHEAVGMV